MRRARAGMACVCGVCVVAALGGGCGSSGSGGPPSGAPDASGCSTDASASGGDGGGSDSGGSLDALVEADTGDAGDAGTCAPLASVPAADVLPYLPVIRRANACTSAQIGGFVSACSSPTSTTASCDAWYTTSANATCRACIQPANGGILDNSGATLNDANGQPWPNFPGCVAIEDGDAACARALEPLVQCESLACDGCRAANASPQELRECIAAADQGACSAYVGTMQGACFGDFGDAGTFAQCGQGDVTKVVDVICGSGGPNPTGDAGVCTPLASVPAADVPPYTPVLQRLHACSAAQIDAYITACASATANGATCAAWFNAAANQTCAACTQPKTDAGVNDNSGASLNDVSRQVWANLAGCAAILDRSATCASALEPLSQCQFVACDGCRAAHSPWPKVQQCLGEATQGACSAYEVAVQAACASDLADGGAVQRCGDGDLATVINVVCGAGG